jgi:uncharacterized repeat protein (TIGR03803 family)
MKKLWFFSLAIVSFALASFSSSQTFQPCPVPTSQSYTLLHSFGTNGHGPNDPRFSGIIAQSRGGNMFSTASDTWTGGDGTVFKITPQGVVIALHTFNGTDGFEPLSGLTLSTGGHYWGTTAQGGLYGHGTLFKMSADGALTTLHDFTGGDDGGLPGAPPIEGIDENFYGTTGVGGKSGSNGTVYRISWSGAFQTIHSFGDTIPSGIRYPNGPLVQGSDGFLYGTTHYGGSNGLGTIFRINVSGGFRTLVNFRGGTSGANPFGELIEGNDGNFYGVASGDGGSNGSGVLFKVSPSGKLTILHSFTGRADGSNPVGGLVQATDGNLYGTNDVGGGSGWGVLFCYSPGAVPTGLTRFHVLHDFNLATGASPQVTLLQHTNGKLYGDTAVGGSVHRGAFYSFDAGLGPFISFMPRARKVGHGVKILGQGFTGASAVSFNGTHASFVVVSDTFIKARVPDGATSGFLAVKTPSGTLKSNRTFLVKPQIVGFSPASGMVGTTVVINGISLKQTSKVTFDGVATTNFTIDSDSQITVTVPTGAQSGRIGITTTGAPVYSVAGFVVLP